jgi:hypothetical protein
MGEMGSMIAGGADYLTPTDFAHALGLSRGETVREWCAEGKIPGAFRVSDKGKGRWLYDILKGRVDLGFDRLPALVNAIRRAAPGSDIPARLLTWLVSRCEGFVLQEVGELPSGSVEEEVDDITLASMELIREKIEAMRDGNMDAREREKLYRYCMRIQRECNQALLTLAPQEERKRA